MGIDLQEGYDSIGSSIQKNQKYKQLSNDYKRLKKKYGDAFEKNKKETADQVVENLARSKQGLLQSFEDAIKEASIDCELYKAHNLIQHDYKCFKFDEPSLFEEQIGPAFNRIYMMI